MSEDYKKIALEDVKKGQRIRIVEKYPAYTATFEGAVTKVNTYWKEISLGGADVNSVTISSRPSVNTTILLLEDAPEPKIVSVQTVTITRYDDGSEKTRTVSEGIPVSTRIETKEQFNAQEEHLRGKTLKDRDGDYWTYREGRWCWTFAAILPGVTWNTPAVTGTLEESLPVTIVENVGD